MTNNLRRRHLLVGPLPPPLGGASISFQIFYEEFKRNSHIEKVDVLDSSAPFLKARSRIIAAESFTRAIRIVFQFTRMIGRTDQVLIFGSNGFILSFTPLLLMMTKVARKPCYIRVFGGSLDDYYASLPSPLRNLLRFTLRRADGVLVQTELVHRYFLGWVGSKLYVVPGYRYIDNNVSFTVPNRETCATSSKELRLVYVGHIKEEKGVFVLLDALELLLRKGIRGIACHFYGPIHSLDEARFRKELSNCISANYMGVIPHEQVVPTMATYNVFVFPSYYPGEGHPGVLIEAILAHLPVIATDFRSVPELIMDHVNGLLVRPKDPVALAEAIKVVYEDRSLLDQMAVNNAQLKYRFDAHRVVPQFFKILGVDED